MWEHTNKWRRHLKGSCKRAEKLSFIDRSLSESQRHISDFLWRQWTALGDVISILWWLMAPLGAAKVTHVNGSPEKVRTNGQPEGPNFPFSVIVIRNCNNQAHSRSSSMLVPVKACSTLVQMRQKNVNVEAFSWTRSGQKSSVVYSVAGYHYSVFECLSAQSV